MSAFAILVGATAALIAAMAAWAFRTAGAPLWAKVILCIAPVVITFGAPAALNQSLGYPVSTTFDSLPACFDLVSFSPDDKNNRVAIWVIEGVEPRAYDLPIDKRIVSGIKAFIMASQPGTSVHLCKDDGSAEQRDSRYTQQGSNAGGQGGLHIDESKNLPLKPEAR